MPVMMEKLYDALRAADVPDDKARAAAVEAANFDNRLNSIEARLTKVEADVAAIKWMLGVNIVLNLATLAGLFTVFTRLPH
jgi:hypothetical protein